MNYEEQFKERTKNHIELVNKYAKKLNKTYTEHDSDKFDALLYGYKFYNKEDKTEEEKELLNECTRLHISRNCHHPEYWSDADLTKFSRENPTVCDCKKMPFTAIEEMCCDWCAMSEELGNTPYEWANKVINKRWFFNNEQISYIHKILGTLWGMDKIAEMYIKQKPMNRFNK